MNNVEGESVSFTDELDWVAARHYRYHHRNDRLLAQASHKKRARCVELISSKLLAIGRHIRRPHAIINNIVVPHQPAQKFVRSFQTSLLIMSAPVEYIVEFTKGSRATGRRHTSRKCHIVADNHLLDATAATRRRINVSSTALHTSAPMDLACP